MRTVIFSLLVALGGGASGVAFAAPKEASESDLAALSAELANLEAELRRLEASEPERAASLADRVEAIREEAIYLKVKMQKHRESGAAGTGVSLGEVEELRGAIGELRAAMARAPAEDAASREAILPAGTEFAVRLEKSLSSETARVGDRFTATTIVPVDLHGDIVVPAGAVLEGVVEMVDRAEGRTDRTARLVLAFDTVAIGDRRYALSATVVGASERLETDIGAEKTKIGVGAGIGGILGAVLGGKKGALAGILIGGSGAVLATEGKNVELPRGTVLTVRLDRDLVTRP